MLLTVCVLCVFVLCGIVCFAFFCVGCVFVRVSCDCVRCASHVSYVCDVFCVVACCCGVVVLFCVVLFCIVALCYVALRCAVLIVLLRCVVSCRVVSRRSGLGVVCCCVLLLLWLLLFLFCGFCVVAVVRVCVALHDVALCRSSCCCCSALLCCCSVVL